MDAKNKNVQGLGTFSDQIRIIINSMKMVKTITSLEARQSNVRGDRQRFGRVRQKRERLRHSLARGRQAILRCELGRLRELGHGVQLGIGRAEGVDVQTRSAATDRRRHVHSRDKAAQLCAPFARRGWSDGNNKEQ